MVNIGKITGTHGYDGTVKIAPTGNYPERFKKLKKVMVSWAGGRKNAEMEIERIRISGTTVFIKFKEIPNREEARTYFSGYLQVKEEEVWPLPEGEYYFFQIQGLEVIDEEKGHLGFISEILETGANNVYIVERENKKDLLIPAIPQVVKKIDLEKRIMIVRLLPGLEDL